MGENKPKTQPVSWLIAVLIGHVACGHGSCQAQAPCPTSTEPCPTSLCSHVRLHNGGPIWGRVWRLFEAISSIPFHDIFGTPALSLGPMFAHFNCPIR